MRVPAGREQLSWCELQRHLRGDLVKRNRRDCELIRLGMCAEYVHPGEAKECNAGNRRGRQWLSGHVCVGTDCIRCA